MLNLNISPLFLCFWRGPNIFARCFGSNFMSENFLICSKFYYIFSGKIQRKTFYIFSLLLFLFCCSELLFPFFLVFILLHVELESKNTWKQTYLFKCWGFPWCLKIVKTKTKTKEYKKDKCLKLCIVNVPLLLILKHNDTINLRFRRKFNTVLSNIKFELKCPFKKGSYVRDPTKKFNLKDSIASLID